MKLIKKDGKKERNKENNVAGKTKNNDKSSKVVGVTGIKCFFGKKFGHMKKECRRYKRGLEKRQAKGNEVQGFTTKRVPNMDELKVFVGNGVHVEVEFIGEVKIELESGFILDLFEVAYVPSKRMNLVSVARLVKAKFEAVFNDVGFSILKNKISVGNGTLVNDMFSLNIKGSEHIMNVANTSKTQSKNESPNLWHKRLCHISRDRIITLCKEHVLPPLDLDELDEICISCVKGKLTNARKKGAIKSTNLLELIHIDICGPFPTQTHVSFKYFITFTNDLSRFGYVYLIAEKSNALDMFKVFKAEVENQLDLKIKVVRSDRGGEFYGRFDEAGRNLGCFARFLQQEGIVAQYTNRGTPQQNGVFERRNRTLKDMMRSMIASTNLPIFLWGEALKTTNYIPNRVPTKSVNQIHFELWNKRKSSLNHIRVWGCKAEAKLYNPLEKKLDARTTSCFFIVYPERTKGYRFYCPNNTTRFVETGRAVFIEEKGETIEDRTLDFDEQTESNTMHSNEIEEEDYIVLSNTVLQNEETVPQMHQVDVNAPVEMNINQLEIHIDAQPQN
ncbi:unnamed protein product [Prunus armeniaca]